MKITKWRTLLGMIVVYIAVFYNLIWIWGIFLLVWVIPDIITGTTNFIEPVTKKEHPIIFWIVVLSWFWMGVYCILAAFYPSLLAT